MSCSLYLNQKLNGELSCVRFTLILRTKFPPAPLQSRYSHEFGAIAMNFIVGKKQVEKQWKHQVVMINLATC